MTDNGDGTVSFVFNRNVSSVVDASGFSVDGDDGIAVTSILGGNVAVSFSSAPFAPHVPYSIASFAGIVFSPPGAPTYPLVGTTT